MEFLYQSKAKKLLVVMLLIVQMPSLLGNGDLPKPEASLYLLKMVTNWKGIQHLSTHIGNIYKTFCDMTLKDRQKYFRLGDIAKYSGKDSDTSTVPREVFARLSNLDRMYQQLPWYAVVDAFKLRSVYWQHIKEICNVTNYVVEYEPTREQVGNNPQQWVSDLCKKHNGDPNFKIRQVWPKTVKTVQHTDEHRYKKFTELVAAAKKQSSLYKTESLLSALEYSTYTALLVAKQDWFISKMPRWLYYPLYYPIGALCLHKAVVGVAEFIATQVNPDIDIKPDLE